METVFLFGLFCVGQAGPEIDSGQRDHVFFLGLDISVLQPEGFLPIEGFDRGNVTVSAEGASRVVKLSKLEDVDSKIQPKVSSASVVLGEVQGFRTYSPENDPTFKAIRTQSQMVADEMKRESDYTSVMGNRAVADQNMAHIVANTTDPAMAQAAGQAAAKLEKQTQQMSRGIGSVESLDTMSHAVDDEGSTSDAYAVTCTVSSANPFENAYAVLLTNILFPGTSTPVRALAFERLPEIDESPRKVRFTQKWLPVGYHVKGYEIHTYREDGSEIATNLSKKRAELSRSEAFQFLLFQYVSSNKLENLSARLVRELLPSDFHLYVPQAQMGRTVHLNIDENGGASNVRLEEIATDDTDAFLNDAFADVYFFPALAYGEPIESTLTITLAEMVR